MRTTRSGLRGVTSLEGPRATPRVTSSAYAVPHRSGVYETILGTGRWSWRRPRPASMARPPRACRFRIGVRAVHRGGVTGSGHRSSSTRHVHGVSLPSHVGDAPPGVGTVGVSQARAAVSARLLVGPVLSGARRACHPAGPSIGRHRGGDDLCERWISATRESQVQCPLSSRRLVDRVAGAVSLGHRPGSDRGIRGIAKRSPVAGTVPSRRHPEQYPPVCQCQVSSRSW